jgi:hypothetical protein
LLCTHAEEHQVLRGAFKTIITPTVPAVFILEHSSQHLIALIPSCNLNVKLERVESCSPQPILMKLANLVKTTSMMLGSQSVLLKSFECVSLCLLATSAGKTANFVV